MKLITLRADELLYGSVGCFKECQQVAPSPPGTHFTLRRYMAIKMIHGKDESKG